MSRRDASFGSGGLSLAVCALVAACGVDGSATGRSGNPAASTGGAGGAATGGVPGSGGATGTGGVPGSGGATGTGVSRPASNTGVGFFALGSKIYDANGAEFVIRGINHTHWWGSNDVEAIPYIANAHPNTVRAVFGDGMGATTPDAKRAVAQAYIDHGIAPMVEYHSGTCKPDASYLQSIVDMWVDPANVAWLNALERYTILNIANEWGPNSTVWRDAYIDAVARLRAAGIKNLLVIDSGECGQVAETVTTWGRQIFDADPEKNVAFSVHMYTYWRDPGDPTVGSWGGLQPYDMNAELDALVGTGLPIIVGEFSWDPSDSVTYSTRPALKLYESHHVGWLAWSWNQNQDPLLDLVTGYTYAADTDLTAFGKLIVTDPEVGLKALATPATVFP